MDDDTIDQAFIQNNSIKIDTIDNISKGIFQIVSKEKKFTGFLMKLNIDNEKELYFMITCNHCIDEGMLDQEIFIFDKISKVERSFYIKLDKNKRFIKYYKKSDNLDITVVRIYKSEIDVGMNFLIPDKNYINGYDHYLEYDQIFVFGYPKNETQKLSYGHIVDYKNDYFFHTCDTDKGNSGSVLVNTKGEIVGIHTSYHKHRKLNKGIFIKPIIEDLLKNEQEINEIKEENNSIVDINQIAVEEEKESNNLLISEDQNKNLQTKKNIKKNTKCCSIKFYSIVVSLLISIALTFYCYRYLNTKNVKIYHKNGALKFIGNINNGYGSEYNEIGILLYEGYFKKGKRNGKGRENYDNGNIKYEGNFINGKYSGKGKLYSNNGTLKYNGEWLNGEKNNFGKEYNENKTIIYEGYFKEGKYNENKTIIYEGYFKDGKRNGKGRENYDNGNIKYDGEFINNKYSGKGKLYNFKRKIIYNGEWLNGEKNNFGKEYNENKTIIYEGYFKEGKIILEKNITKITRLYLKDILRKVKEMEAEKKIIIMGLLNMKENL